MQFLYFLPLLFISHLQHSITFISILSLFFHFFSGVAGRRLAPIFRGDSRPRRPNLPALLRNIIFKSNSMGRGGGGLEMAMITHGNIYIGHGLSARVSGFILHRITGSHFSNILQNHYSRHYISPSLLNAVRTLG